ncbi:MAG: hypothetical protein ACNA7U_00720 [Candidatus Izemoplasmataceae bacterium]|jgi:alpha-N-acetylglucosamine transferase|uniref:hypothetical protein n=1 Tax=Liberiplasma polymorphum TaxID=3374570 RepID=UPI0037767072
MSKNAFVTFVMRNDSFIPGALVFAYGLRKQETTADIICIVSEQVSQNGIEALKVLFDDVISLAEIFVPHKERHERQDRPFLFTRFNALRLGKDGDLGKAYEKIIIADADLLPIRDYDTLFTLPAPAGVINEKKEYCMEYHDGKYIIPDSVYVDGTWIWHRVYEKYPMGTRIPKEITDRVKTDYQNMGMNAALYLFEPTMDLYDEILNDVNQVTTQKEISNYPWPEMQYITAKMSGKWHNMDLKYSSFNGYPLLDVLRGIHYAGLKPWQMKHRSIKHFARTEDYKLWYAVYIQMMKEYDELMKNTKLKKLDKEIHYLLEDDRYVFHQKYLPNLIHLFKS